MASLSVEAHGGFVTEGHPEHEIYQATLPRIETNVNDKATYKKVAKLGEREFLKAHNTLEYHKLKPWISKAKKELGGNSSLFYDLETLKQEHDEWDASFVRWFRDNGHDVPQRDDSEGVGLKSVELVVAIKWVVAQCEKNSGKKRIEFCGEFLKTHRIKNRPNYTPAELNNNVSQYLNKLKNKTSAK